MSSEFGDMGSQQRGLKRKISEISGFMAEDSSDSSSVSSNFRSGVGTHQWNNGKYDTIYLDLLFEAIIGSFTSIGRQYDVEFWNAFTTELNKRITRRFFDDTPFSGFTMPVVINYGVVLRATYRGYKGDPRELANFDHFDKCFRKCVACSNLPVFPNLELRSERSNNCSSSASCRKREGRTTTSVNEEISSRLAYHVSNGSFDVKNLNKAMDYFHDEEALCTKTWLKLLEKYQVTFLNDSFT